MKRVVITGGTGGLGSAIAHVFKGHGWEVIALGRNDLDLSDSSVVEDFFRRNPCELLVCGAGTTDDAPLARLDEASWDEVFTVNYEYASRCALAAMTQMPNHGEGHVVFISSHAAFHPAVGQAAYASAKAALLGLAEALAQTWGAKGIRVNAILPGFLETPMTEVVSEKRRDAVRAAHCLGVFNTSKVAAGFIHFLHEHLPHTSGQIFQLDSRKGFF